MRAATHERYLVGERILYALFSPDATTRRPVCCAVLDISVNIARARGGTHRDYILFSQRFQKFTNL